MKLKRIRSKHYLTYIDINEIYGFSICETFNEKNLKIEEYRVEFYTSDGKTHYSDHYNTQIEALKFAIDILGFEDDILNFEDDILNTAKKVRRNLPPTLPFPSKLV